MKKLDLTKPVQTRDGRPARILATDVRHAIYPVVAVVTHPDGGEAIIVATREGHYFSDYSHPSHLDLMNVPETKVLELWVVVHSCGTRTFHRSYEDARAQLLPANGGTIIHVKQEYIEGEDQP